MSQLTTQLSKSPEAENNAKLPTRTLGYISVAIAVASLSSCVPYAYPPQVGSYQNAPARNYNQAPQEYNYRANNYVAPQNSYNIQGSGIEEQTKSMREETTRIAAYNRAVNASANAIRAGIPSQFQNRDTRAIALMQAKATTPTNLSADQYRSVIEFKAAQANLRLQKMRAIGF